MTFNGQDNQGQLPVQAPSVVTSARDVAWLTERIRRGKREMFSEITTISPSLAQAMLAINGHNRKLAARRVAAYADVIRDGRWKVTHQGLAMDKDGRLLDGQHRLAAIIQVGIPVKMMVSFGWDAENFALIDTGGNRSAQDLATIDGLDYASVRAAVARAVLVAEAKDRTSTPDRQAVLQKCREMDDDDMAYACRVGQLIGGGHKIMQTSAAAWAIWAIRKQSKHVHRLDEFIEGVKTGADLATTSPILKFRENAKKVPFTGGASRQTKQAAAMVLAWNAWVEKKRSVSLNWTSSTILPDVA